MFLREYSFELSTKMPTSDEYCPHCDNHFLLVAKTPKPNLNIESADVRADSRILKDPRIEGEQELSISNAEHFLNRLG
jgi:hypothetical protein